MIKSVFFCVCLAILSNIAVASPVNINTAGADQIAKALKGIGPSKAAAIIEFRLENGPFLAIKDLVKVKGIGEKTVESNKGDILIVLDGDSTN
ncbi:MAG: helix-hairpin-helix domain-containing protein [Gammaproteobacteria bacterium]|nr:helix-hairpin-helix domain-containing protein [Gammaproteobacteria bacterium]